MSNVRKREKKNKTKQNNNNSKTELRVGAENKLLSVIFQALM